MNAIRQATQKKPGEQNQGGVCGERRWTAIAAPRQIQDEKTRDHRIVNVDESDGDPGRHQRTAHPSTPASMSRRPVILGYLYEQRCRRERSEDLEARCVIEGAQHLSY